MVSPSILRILLQDGKQKAEKSQAESSAGRSVQSSLMPAGVPPGCALEAQRHNVQDWKCLEIHSGSNNIHKLYHRRTRKSSATSSGRAQTKYDPASEAFAVQYLTRIAQGWRGGQEI